MEKAWNALKEFAWPFGLCGGAFGILIRFVPSTTVPIELPLAVGTAFLAIIITLIGYLVRAGALSAQPLIRIEQVVEFGKLMLLSKTEQLGVSMGAQIFYREGNHERMIAHGEVINVQLNGFPQLQVTYLPSVEGALISDMTNNKRSILDRIVIKPGVIMPKLESQIENPEGDKDEEPL